MTRSDLSRWRGDVLVIGAGPAGLAASHELADAGLNVLLVDENQRPGGQISRQRFLPVTAGQSNDPAAADDPVSAWGASLRPHLTFLGQSTCHGIADGEAVITTPAGALSVAARSIVVATGGLERVLPVPGWTKLGVMTAGAAQTYLKGSGFFPYRRVVVAGTGPLLLAAAAQLVAEGIEVAAVVEAVRPGAARPRDVIRLLSAPEMLSEGVRYAWTLGKARVPIYPGTGIAEVEGNERVTGVVLGKLRHDWTFAEAEGRRITCDAVLLSHGFTSSAELSSQLGSLIVWDERRDTWRAQRDENFATSAPGVLAVGDCAGVGGVKIARLEGTIAGIVLAARLASLRGYEPRLARLRRRLARLETFRLGMDNIFKVGAGSATWPAPDTCVCRCQDTTLSTVELALSNGIRDLHSLKLWTRAGMGACQGRTCTPVLAGLVARSGRGTAEPKPPSTQFPVRPLPADVLTSLTADQPTHSRTDIA